MKKEGIQTRNRKLSSKGKKKKGCLSMSGMSGMSDIMKPLDHSKFSSFAHSGQLSQAMSSMSAMSAVNHYMHGAGQMGGMGMMGGYMTGPSMHMNGSHHPGLSSLSLPTSSSLNLGQGLGLSNSMVSGMA
jgi:hypothetical protein